MRLVKYFFTVVIVIALGVTIFMPKERLYYKAEELLNSKGITIGNEEIIDSLGNLKVLHPVTFYQGADIARASNIIFKPLLVVNSIEAENIEFIGIAKKFSRVSITLLKANHNILKPLYIKLEASGSFGEAVGYINLRSRVIHIDITKEKDIASIQKFLTKGEKGWQYESNF